MIRDKLNKRLPESMKAGYGTLYIHTDRGLDLMDRIADWKYTDRVTDMGVLSFLLTMAASLGVLAFIAVTVVQSPPEPTAAQDPVNLLAIPGVNDFLPLSATAYILSALFIAAGVHELAHGIAMRAEDVTVEEVGIVLLTVFPIAAYVMPDEEEFATANVRARARILSAGVFANLLVFAIVTVLFMLPMTGNPLDAFAAYFGTVLGEQLPASQQITSLSIVTKFLFWTWFFNINLAFVNALPVVTLDGGRIAGLLGDLVTVPYNRSTVTTAIVGVTSLGTLGVFLIAVFGPVFLSG